MHLHLPKPLHGWREFTGEVGIIVVGVLIALGAEQVVEKLRWKAEVTEARTSLDVQLARSEFAALERIQAHDCIARKLDRIDDLISTSDRPKIVQVDLSPIRLWSTSAWESATASGAVAHMSPDQRNLYADLFAFTAAIGELNSKEYDLVGEMRLLNRPRTLSEGTRNSLILDIARLRQFNRIMTVAARQWLDDAKLLHLRMDEDTIAELRHPLRCIMPDDPAAKDG